MQVLYITSQLKTPIFPFTSCMQRLQILAIMISLWSKQWYARLQLNLMKIWASHDVQINLAFCYLTLVEIGKANHTGMAQLFFTFLTTRF
jgi:hypothetical protein